MWSRAIGSNDTFFPGDSPSCAGLVNQKLESPEQVQFPRIQGWNKGDKGSWKFPGRSWLDQRWHRDAERVQSKDG
jgi:hypothetical protein